MSHSNQQSNSPSQHITIHKLVGKDAIEAIRAEYRKELEAQLLGKGAPEDKPHTGSNARIDIEREAMRKNNAAWRQHIHNVLKGTT